MLVSRLSAILAVTFVSLAFGISEWPKGCFGNIKPCASSWCTGHLESMLSNIVDGIRQLQRGRMFWMGNKLTKNGIQNFLEVFASPFIL